MRTPAPPHPTLLVAIAGGSGSGKTWLAHALRRRLRPHAALLSLDDFYRDLSALPPSRRARVNFDDPAALDWNLLRHCLKEIQAGRPVVLPRYDFATHTRRPSGRRWRPRPIVLVEGLWPWSRPGMARFFAFRCFRDGAEELRLARRAERDTRERGRSRASVFRQWRRQVQPMYDRHIGPQRRQAHEILGNEVHPRDLARLADHVMQLAGSNPACRPACS